MIRISILNEREIKQGGLELLEGWSREGEDVIWIDITSTNRDDIEPLLEEWFGFHELAAEDSLSENTLPKFDPFPDYDFFVFRSIRLNVSEHGMGTEKLACFLGENFLFTVHREALSAIDSIWTRLPQDRRMARRGPDFLLYAVIDMLVDAHFPILEEIEERMDEIHELIFLQPSQTLLDEVLDLKRDLNVLRRHTLPQRELLNQISRGDGQFIKQDHLIYFRDLYDHMFRIGESIDVERDLATGTMEAYMSVVANRTNEIVKILTIFSTIMLPMNFIAGIYGMNFEYMPELKWHFGYVWAFGVMLSVALVMLAWFQKKGWLWVSKKELIRTERKIRRALRKKHKDRD